MEIVVVLTARRIQEGLHFHILVFLRDPTGRGRGLNLGLMSHHLVVRYERPDQCLQIVEGVGLTRCDGKLGCSPCGASELIARWLLLFQRSRHSRRRWCSSSRQRVAQGDGCRRRFVPVDFRRSKNPELTSACGHNPTGVLNGVRRWHTRSCQVQTHRQGPTGQREPFGFHTDLLSFRRPTQTNLQQRRGRMHWRNQKQLLSEPNSNLLICSIGFTTSNRGTSFYDV